MTMNRKIHTGLLVTATLLGATAVTGAESAADAARRCGQILGERERLACFDRAFPAGPETSALAESRAAPAPAPVPVPVPVPAPAPAAVAAAPVAASTAVSAPVAAAPALGDEQVRKPEQAAQKSASEPTSLTARVTAVKEVRQDTWRMHLDNGQVWLQMDMSSRFHPEVGNTVEIQRKKMGGYSLALAGDKKSPWIRVSRVE